MQLLGTQAELTVACRGFGIDADHWNFGPVAHAMSLARWFYPGGRPNRLAALLNRGSAALHSLGIAPNYLVTLEVQGRSSGAVIRLPLVMTVVDGRRYLVSMLGTTARWVQNVRAAAGHVVLRHGRREFVRLKEVPADQRAPILKAYLQRAPGARAHIPVDRRAPLDDFERIAAQFPVFRVMPR